MSIFPSRSATTGGEEIAAQFEVGDRISRRHSDHSDVNLTNNPEPRIGRSVVSVPADLDERVAGSGHVGLQSWHICRDPDVRLPAR